MGKHGSGPAGWLLLLPTTAWGWELEQCSPLPCHVSRPRTQWCLLTLPLGPEVLPWVGLSGKVLTEEEAWAGNPSASRLRGGDGWATFHDSSRTEPALPGLGGDLGPEPGIGPKQWQAPEGRPAGDQPGTRPRGLRRQQVSQRSSGWKWAWVGLSV